MASRLPLLLLLPLLATLTSPSFALPLGSISLRSSRAPFSRHPPPRRTPPPCLLFGDELEQKRKECEAALAAAQELVALAAAAEAEAEALVSRRAAEVRAAQEKVREAEAAADRCLAAEAEGRAALAAAAAEREGKEEGVAAARAAVDAAAAEQAAWEEANPLEAAGKAGVKVGGAIADVAANALLTTLFGESKASRERRAAAAPPPPPPAPPAPPVDGAALDAELRSKRQAAEATLKARRPRPLSETVATSTLDAALGAAAAAAAGGEPSGGLGAVASWAAARREALRAEAALQEKHNRLALFASDLALLGIPLDEHTAGALDEKALRKAFRERSRVLHPDVRAQRLAEETEGVPSVYELNAAYEAVRKLL
ncbi:hypothetical protein AB1Y20_011744 [Prymnesium parvum]|uniref:J domain-containing protein n=1 Tax=Prymnesium parvum TaxID=97485 RepID=A0AB34IJW2_PRYPA